MKKILVVTTKFPFPLYRGDNLRIYSISKHLSKKNKLDLIYTGSKENFQKIKFFDKIMWIKTNNVNRFFSILYFLLRGESIRVGYFFSLKMLEKIEEIHKNYDCIVFHKIEGSNFLPNDYKGKKILEMTDLMSENYFQLYKKFSFFNPLKYIFFIEEKILRKYEKKVISLFDHTVFVSKSDLNSFSLTKILKKKIKIIPLGLNQKRKLFKFNKKNKNIVFIGNINYLPNKIACFDFIEKIMPLLERKGLSVNFKIIGRTSKILKFRLTRFNNVYVYDNVKSFEKLCANAICGIANITIATGMQFKVLEYMSMGLPTVVSEKCFRSINFKKNHDLMVYNNNDQFVKQIIKLSKEKNFANKISKNGYRKIVSNYGLDKSLKQYCKLI